ncbi:MAG: hypothetical protein J3K34DRAFT_461440 [Monoraphidium minutum]|nr:MAG: hypothetical protein J3K34DRAFT_461440 [Monoraphidium minutum]
MRFAVVGDVHERWSGDADGAALRALGAHHAIWVGDIGNSENVELVRQIAGLDFPKSVILGNHDAWTQLSARGRASATKRMRVTAAPADALRLQQLSPGGGGDGEPARSPVHLQLDALGDAHVGYREARLEGRRVAVVGARPFSKGGSSWESIAPFMSAVCGVDSMEASAERIVSAAAPAAARGDAVVMVAHNGPSGLGGARHDICGVDWRKEEGDHGDPDLRAALDTLAARGAAPAAVVFGHMHHTLRGGGLRQMVRVDPETGTAFLNAATVPRVQRADAPGATLHHFLVFELIAGGVERAADVWVRVTRRAAGGGDANGGGAEECVAVVESETDVLRTARGEGGGVVRIVWDAHAQQWEHVPVPGGAAGASGGGGAAAPDAREEGREPAGVAVAAARAKGGSR